jgi:imidazoleglycerol phosphate dehydratase HisB
VLEQRVLTRVGGTQPITIDARIICATNRDLEAEVRRERFREDLFFRLGAFTIVVPPLRNRRASKVEVSLDVSNRAYLVYKVGLANDRIGSFDATLTEDFLYAFCQNAGIDLHVELRYGKSPHHVVEAVFKGLARALRVAVELDPRVKGLPTVKGAL